MTQSTGGRGVNQLNVTEFNEALARANNQLDKLADVSECYVQNMKKMSGQQLNTSNDARDKVPVAAKTSGNVSNALDMMPFIKKARSASGSIDLLLRTGEALRSSYLEGASESTEFNKQIAVTGAQFDVTSKQLEWLSQQLAGAGISVGQAANVLAKIVSTGQFKYEQMEQIAQTALIADRAKLQSADETISHFKKIFSQPTLASYQLNSQFQYLSKQDFEKVALQEQLEGVGTAGETAADLYSSMITRLSNNHLAGLGFGEKLILQANDIYEKISDGLRESGRNKNIKPYREQLTEKEVRLAEFERGLKPERERTGFGYQYENNLINIDYDRQRNNQLREIEVLKKDINSLKQLIISEESLKVVVQTIREENNKAINEIFSNATNSHASNNLSQDVSRRNEPASEALGKVSSNSITSSFSGVCNSFEKVCNELIIKLDVLLLKMTDTSDEGNEFGKQIRLPGSPAVKNTSLKEISDSTGEHKSQVEGGINWLEAAKQGLSKYGKSLKVTLADVEKFAGKTFNAIGDNMLSMLTTGKANWAEFTRSTLSMLSQLLMKQAMAGLINYMIPGSPGHALGGYTGPGAKYEPAGVVHRGEFVFTKEATSRIGVSNLYRLMRGYASGGYVGESTAALPALSGVSVYAPVTVQSTGPGTDSNPQGMDQLGKVYQQVIDRSINEGIAKAIRPGGLIWNTQHKR
ncbi:phage tail length tape measure family protein [Entomohabitans teleogrylli]|uniref:phage tail length tape measure family protein n=1 Tax=Entomohabitans teleogrylli TaxID=1384589 RepID=UPI00073D6F23|nr:phage tail length tape measure family protein [Entomohabitans teleogrylli]